ncbi:MAG: PKD domain-containing protein, partial [bacterium]
MEKGFISHFNGSHFCKSIIFLICYVFLVQSCIWIMPPSFARSYPASPVSSIEESQGIFSEIADAFKNALDLFFPAEAYAAPPKVICVPWYPADLLVPHETWPGKSTILKGIAKDPDNNLTGGKYKWDFGDGTTSSEQNPTHVFTTGSYSVSLTVTEEDEDSKTITK